MVYRRVRVVLNHPNACTFFTHLCKALHENFYAEEDDDFNPVVDVPMESKGPMDDLPVPVGALVKLRSIQSVRQRTKVAEAMKRAGGFDLKVALPALCDKFPKIVVDGARQQVHIKLGPDAPESKRSLLEACVQMLRSQFADCVLSDDDEQIRARLARPGLRNKALRTLWEEITLAYPELKGRDDARADFEKHEAQVGDVSLLARIAVMLSIEKAPSADGLMRWKSLKAATRAFEVLGLKDVRSNPRYTSRELAAEIKLVMLQRGLRSPSEVMAMEEGEALDLAPGPLFDANVVYRFGKLQGVSRQLGGNASAYMQVMVRSKETTPGFLGAFVMGQVIRTGCECARHILRRDASVTPMGVVYCGEHTYILPSAMQGLSVRKAAEMVLAITTGADTLTCDLCHRPITAPERAEITTAECARAKYGAYLGRRSWIEEHELAFAGCEHVFHKRCAMACSEYKDYKDVPFACPRTH